MCILSNTCALHLCAAHRMYTHDFAYVNSHLKSQMSKQSVAAPWSKFAFAAQYIRYSTKVQKRTGKQN
jgi:hypothetical protein